MRPVNPLCSRFNLVTRLWPPVITPYHSLSGLSLNQLVLFFQLGPPAASYRATSAALSGVGTGVPAAGVVAHVSPARSSISWSQAWNAESGGAQSPTLPWKWKDISTARSVRLDGSSPVNWFWSRCRYSKLVRLASSGGIGPVSRLEESNSCPRLATLPSCGGIAPVSWLEWSDSTPKLARLPS